MRTTELKMTESDINKLSINNKVSIKMHLVFLIVGTSLLYITWDKNDIFLKILFGVFSLIGILGLWGHFLSQKGKRDLNEKIKIIVETRVIDKREISKTESDGEGTIYKTSYRLIFENSKRYEVSRYIFDKVSIGDDINIEYAKYSKWILKIYSNNLNIENSKYLQKI